MSARRKPDDRPPREAGRNRRPPLHAVPPPEHHPIPTPDEIFPKPLTEGARAADELPKRRIFENAANSGRTPGNATLVVARRSQWGYGLQRCIWCNRSIEPGELYVKQDRWLVWAGHSFPRGPRHETCWERENEHAVAMQQAGEAD